MFVLQEEVSNKRSTKDKEYFTWFMNADRSLLRRDDKLMNKLKADE